MSALRIALYSSVAYDWAALVLLMAMPAWLFRVLGHPVPLEPFLFRMSALPLAVLPVVYLMAAKDPQRHPDLVRASIWLRVVGALSIAVVVAWQRPPAPLAYVLFVAGDLVWAAVYRWCNRGPT